MRGANMSLFDLFRRKRDDLPKEVRRMFAIQERYLNGKKLADEAISYRNVGNYEKAFELLKRAIDGYDYKSAITLVGTTAVMKGDIDAAIEWFSLQLRTLPDNGDYCLIELYANLGSIYNQYVRDYDRALEMYEKGLDACPPTDIDHRGYQLMVTNVYRDMAIVYQNLGDPDRAREYAQKVLQHSPELDDVVKSRDHLQLGRIMLEVGSYTEAQHHAKSAIECYDDPKNSMEYCRIMFLSIYQQRDYLYYFKHSKRFQDLEDIVTRLEALHDVSPEDAQTLFLLAASSACLNFTNCHWQAVLQGHTLPDEIVKYFKMYGDLPETSGATKEKKLLLGEMQVAMLRDRIFGAIENPTPD